MSTGARMFFILMTSFFPIVAATLSPQQMHADQKS